MKSAARKSARLAIVVAQFNLRVTESLLRCCCEELERNGIPREKIKIVRVPGAFEIPFIAQTLAQTHRYHAIICLGCVIKGETSHDHHVATWASIGIGLVSLNTGVPTLFGVLTPSSEAQALKRTRPGPLNRGREVAQAALKMVQLVKQVRH